MRTNVGESFRSRRDNPGSRFAWVRQCTGPLPAYMPGGASVYDGSTCDITGPAPRRRRPGTAATAAGDSRSLLGIDRLANAVKARDCAGHEDWDTSGERSVIASDSSELRQHWFAVIQCVCSTEAASRSRLCALLIGGGLTHPHLK